jgi:hypothetical protein
LRWNLKYGANKVQLKIFEERHKRGLKTTGYSDRPQLAAEQLWAWRAFNILSSGRPYIGGMAVTPGAIPFRDVDAYARRYGVQGDHFEVLLHLISALDSCFLEYYADQQKKAAP